MKKTLLLLTLLGCIHAKAQFTPPIFIDTVYYGITEVITADLNQNGHQDIVVTKKGSTDSFIAYYPNLGSGIFGSQVLIDQSILFPQSLASADFNTDGWIDIISMDGNTSNGKLYIMYNNAGTFGSPITLDSNFFYPQKVKVADMDNDSIADVVFISDLELIIYTSDGIGGFTKSIIPQGHMTEYYNIDIADITNNGYKDIVVSGIKTLIYTNNGGMVSFDQTRTDSIADNFSLTTLAHLNDFDNDGDIDLIKNKSGTTALYYLENDGQGFYNTSPTILEPQAQQCKSMASADFDNDGDLDVLTTLPQEGKVVWYQNNGLANFGSQQLIYQGQIAQTEHVCTGNLNNDSLPDVIWSSKVTAHLNNLNGISVKENTAQSIGWYSNPIKNKMVLNSTALGKINIYTPSGQLVSVVESIDKGENQIMVDLKAGVYQFLFTSAKGLTQNFKVIVE